MRKMSPLALWLLGGVVGIGVLILAAAWLLVHWGTHPLRIPVPHQPPSDLEPCEEITLRTTDGLELSGWFLPRPGARATVILCHGHQFNRLQMAGLPEVLAGLPLQYLLFDFRRAGRSGGHVSWIGAEEWRDVVAAVDWLEQDERAAGKPMGVFGLSMGGAAAILAAAKDPRIAAVATQGAYADLDSALRQRCRLILGFLYPVLYAPTRLLGIKRLGRDPASIAPSEAAARLAPRPLLLIHGAHDLFVAPRDVAVIHANAREPKELVFLPHSWHVTVSPADWDLYQSALRRFFQQYLVEARETTRTCPQTGTQ